ncbi:MAG TPA: alpha/beta hydrolase fold domain-containing protein [Nocardioidaceae bacterium]|nr:alpha/beta hydrolase fold domain-containing protein [Nocardioidaceae bacterium]
MTLTLSLPVAPLRAVVGLTSGLVTESDLGVTRQRARAETIARLIPPPRGTRCTLVSLGGVATEQVLLGPARQDTALLYLHGGGYCLGSARVYRGLAARLAAGLGAVGYVPDYRLAPEHRYPAALEDALACYRAILRRGIAPGRVIVVGDSAGGGLALALALALRDGGDPLPAAVGLISPWLDLVPDRTGTRRGQDALLSSASLRTWAREYLGDSDATDPGASPLRGNLEDLPPIVVHSAAHDPLAADAEQLAALVPGTKHVRLDGLWHVPHLLHGVLPAARLAVGDLTRDLAAAMQPAGPRVAIVGAGMSGLCMGDALKQAGYDGFTIHEKAGEVGGTWRENRYPGLTCDVPSRFYSYSFAPNPEWSSAFSPGAEIQEYFVRTAEERGLRDHIRFGSEVTEARWLQDRWHLRTADGREEEAEVLVTATGVLHHPKLPDIEGRDTFAGASFHSARWDDSVDLRDKRVAVIGTGSTGVQITVALAGQVDRLLVFQRTPQWILPVSNTRYSPLSRALFRSVPPLNRLSYHAYQRILEGMLGPAVTRPSWQRTVISSLCRANLRFGVKDPVLRARLAPDYAPMCKRLVMSAGFYPAVQRDDVEVVASGIERIEAGGIRTADGVLHEVDVIVYATGFDAHAYMRPMAITGEDGITLDEAWAEGPRAYRTVAMPGFPNMFMLMGPHSPIGNHSLIAVAEAQAGYVMKWIRRLAAHPQTSVVPTTEATDDYYEHLRSAFPGTVWVSGCQSWYLDDSGVPELWPWTPARHRRMLADLEPEDFRTRTSQVGSP